MALKDILVHLDATEQSNTRLRVAAALARSHDAHLTGLHVLDVALPAFVGDPSGGGAVVAELIERTRREALADAARIEAGFRERLRLEGLAGEWRQPEGIAPELVSLHARYADLAIVGQQDPEGGGSPAAGAILEATLFASGRPVLIVPYAGRFESVGRKVLIGWNASREASRAVHDALPLIARADSVTVLTINPRIGPDGHGEAPGADIALHLARHGLKVEVERLNAPDVADGELLLNRAAELSADLLVVGGYGHSRLRELMLGGVTRTLLRQMTLPVLMSH
ncbi:universal stress protein A [Caldovatus sediminis]|uniref:Universal stress protein A n=1 Tax=Caldovatus sediminis TaxID=2041189 RepID=A0A8J2ZBH5_9PROT|nr:universal stress protein [Caldovatus sediminis]GGG36258.1 universal stress protein A [Caldovatus sediminis]